MTPVEKRIRELESNIHQHEAWLQRWAGVSPFIMPSAFYPTLADYERAEDALHQARVNLAALEALT